MEKTSEMKNLHQNGVLWWQNSLKREIIQKICLPAPPNPLLEETIRNETKRWESIQEQVRTLAGIKSVQEEAVDEIFNTYSGRVSVFYSRW